MDFDAKGVVLDADACGFYDRADAAAFPRGDPTNGSRVFAKLFSWWNGATIGTLVTVKGRGDHVGTDEFGNRYFQSRDSVSYDGRRRRWVLYNGYAEASKVPPDWHGWLRYTYDETPSASPLPRKAWEKAHLPNFTGTPMAWRPPGSLAAEGVRPRADGDYEAWKPE